MCARMVLKDKEISVVDDTGEESELDLYLKINVNGLYIYLIDRNNDVDCVHIKYYVISNYIIHPVSFLP